MFNPNKYYKCVLVSELKLTSREINSLFYTGYNQRTKSKRTKDYELALKKCKDRLVINTNIYCRYFDGIIVFELDLNGSKIVLSYPSDYDHKLVITDHLTYNNIKYNISIYPE